MKNLIFAFLILLVATSCTMAGPTNTPTPVTRAVTTDQSGLLVPGSTNFFHVNAARITAEGFGSGGGGGGGGAPLGVIAATNNGVIIFAFPNGSMLSTNTFNHTFILAGTNGDLTATSFSGNHSGSGSSLTGITAAQVGADPAGLALSSAQHATNILAVEIIAAFLSQASFTAFVSTVPTLSGNNFLTGNNDFTGGITTLGNVFMPPSNDIQFAGSAEIEDHAGTHSIQPNQRTLFNSFGNPSEDYGNCLLHSDEGGGGIDWSNGLLKADVVVTLNWVDQNLIGPWTMNGFDLAALETTNTFSGPNTFTAPFTASNGGTNQILGIQVILGSSVQSGVATFARPNFATRAGGVATIANNTGAEASGLDTIAGGIYSNARGEFSQANGEASEAAGHHALATNDNSLVINESQSNTDVGSLTNQTVVINAPNGVTVTGPLYATLSSTNLVCPVYGPFSNSITIAKGMQILNCVGTNLAIFVVTNGFNPGDTIELTTSNNVTSCFFTNADGKCTIEGNTSYWVSGLTNRFTIQYLGYGIFR
jgi:hypothetical protein